MELVKFREAERIMKEKAYWQKTLEKFQSGCLSRTDFCFTSGSFATISEGDGEFYEGLFKDLDNFMKVSIEKRIDYLESLFDKL